MPVPGHAPQQTVANGFPIPLVASSALCAARGKQPLKCVSLLNPFPSAGGVFFKGAPGTCPLTDSSLTQSASHPKPSRGGASLPALPVEGQLARPVRLGQQPMAVSLPAEADALRLGGLR